MNNTETKITIFTDGSSRGNPGPGGWGAVVVQSSKFKVKNETQEAQVIELGGGEKHTTNNRMELMAAVQGISHTEAGFEITVFTDSKYLINGITSWIKGWKNNGWITKTKDDVINKDLWVKLDSAIKDRNVKWEYIGGHIGIIGNERCDHIATDFADGNKPTLYNGPLSGYDLPHILDVSHDELALKAKKSSGSRAGKAYSYVSSVGGVIHVDHSWAECEKRVKGKKGARYKKSFDIEDEQRIVQEYEEML
ncbi:MAG: ribonuclease HI [Candidatus Taylorbacteria bacterium]